MGPLWTGMRNVNWCASLSWSVEGFIVSKAGEGERVCLCDGSGSTLTRSRLFLKPMVTMDLNPVIHSILGH